ncbi:MAG: ISAs1 family transposase [Oscillospiraceae bacterium]|nr:ISAs1 family transposase [Oscillospiraceae bacterium]
MEEFEKITTTVEHEGYYYKISDVIKILILGLLSSLKTMKEIHGWSKSKRISAMLLEKFGIKKISCYSHFTVLVGLIDSEELNKIFMEFFQKLVETVVGKTIAIDGKTVCSTANMGKYASPLHIASAFVVENGITIGQLASEGKGKEIPCVQELIRLLDIEGATIVTDALHCQKKTAKEILEAGADYVFSVKKNQKELYADVSEMIDFKLTDKYEQLNVPLEKVTKVEKGHGRIDKRTAFVTYEVEWLQKSGKWHGTQSLGAIATTTETRYYISSRKLSPLELLEITRNEWSVESMHWQLDVIFNEDRTTLLEENAQKTLNILRKTVLNVVRTYRDRFEPKLNMVDIMRNCLFDDDFLLLVLVRFDDCV